MYRAEREVRADPADRRERQIHNVPRKLGGVGQTDQVEKGGRGTTRPHADQLLTNHALVGRKSAFRLFSPFLLDGFQNLRIGIKNIDFG